MIPGRMRNGGFTKLRGTMNERRTAGETIIVAFVSFGREKG